MLNKSPAILYRSMAGFFKVLFKSIIGMNKYSILCPHYIKNVVPDSEIAKM